MGNIGKPQKEIYVEPLENPVPDREYVPEEKPVNVPDKEKETVPA